MAGGSSNTGSAPTTVESDRYCFLWTLSVNRLQITHKTGSASRTWVAGQYDVRDPIRTGSQGPMTTPPKTPPDARRGRAAGRGLALRGIAGDQPVRAREPDHQGGGRARGAGTWLRAQPHRQGPGHPAVRGGRARHLPPRLGAVRRPVLRADHRRRQRRPRAHRSAADAGAGRLRPRPRPARARAPVPARRRHHADGAARRRSAVPPGREARPARRLRRAPAERRARLVRGRGQPRRRPARRPSTSSASGAAG